MNIHRFYSAIPVNNLEKCKTFYKDVFFYKEFRSKGFWVGFNLLGLQFVTHQKEDYTPANPIDGYTISAPHFRLILNGEGWVAFSNHLKAIFTPFIIEPIILCKRKVGKQLTMFFFKTIQAIMQLIESHIVPQLEKPIRLQEYAVGLFKTLPTKSGIKKAIKKELILIDRKTTSTAQFINGGETIELFESKKIINFKQLNLELEVLFEDDYLAIIYKPAGIIVSGNSFATIDNALSQNLKKSLQPDAVRPRPVHRLDYPTSGLLLIGKTNSSIIILNKLFENKDIQKTYHAITIGKMEPNGKIDIPIDTKKAFTEFEVLQTVISHRFKFLNLVKLLPKTGRKHQLRKHLLAIENPILGDKEYFKENLILNGKGLYLHASTLEFTNPFTKKTIKITKELPKKFLKIFQV